MAIGGSITGLLLGIFGYVAGAQQTETVLTAMRVMKFIFPVLGYIASLISMHYYCITDSFFSGMMEDIRNGITAENSQLKEEI
jgi:Na+/melibiose symporter-like transporter